MQHIFVLESEISIKHLGPVTELLPCTSITSNEQPNLSIRPSTAALHFGSVDGIQKLASQCITFRVHCPLLYNYGLPFTRTPPIQFGFFLFSFRSLSFLLLVLLHFLCLIFLPDFYVTWILPQVCNYYCLCCWCLLLSPFRPQRSFVFFFVIKPRHSISIFHLFLEPKLENNDSPPQSTILEDKDTSVTLQDYSIMLSKGLRYGFNSRTQIKHIDPLILNNFRWWRSSNLKVKK